MKLLKFFLATALVALVACQKPEPPAPQPKPVTPTAPTGLPPGHPPLDMNARSLPPGAGSEEPNPQWTVPDGWKETPAGPMRRANFTITGPDSTSAEVVVSAFPGDVGGMLNNINRWRGQIGLGPVTAEQADAATSTIDVNRQQAKVVDMTGNQRMIVVTIPIGADSWFFKITGDPALLEAQKERFFDFVKSVKF